MRRRRRRPFNVPRSRAWLFVLALIALVFMFAGFPYFLAGDSAKRVPYEEVPTALTLPAGMSVDDLLAVEVEEVVDGDTLDAFLDGKSVRVRYFGVDTPERGERCYREALDRNDQLVGDFRTTVYLLQDQRKEDQYGRLLGYLFTEDGTSVDATLVAEGYGEAWHQDGQYRDQIVALEDEARAADRGCLWGQ